MANGKKTFNLYTDMIGVFEKLPDDKAGQLIKHIFQYVNDQNPETDDLIINIAFDPIKAKLKRDLKKWEETCEKNRENINKRWNKKSTPEYHRIPSNTTEYHPLPLDTKNTDKDKDKDKEKDIKKKKLHPFAKSPYSDKENFKKKFSSWSNEKQRHYYLSMKEYSETKGAKYMDWGKVAMAWARKDEDNGNTPWKKMGMTV